MDNSEKKTRIFGPFSLTADRRLRFPSGRSVQLSGRLSAALLALLDEGREGITKERLIDLVWPRHQVDEQNLPRAISELRKVFANEGFHPIETVYGYGYRLNLPEVDDGQLSISRRAESIRREAWHRVSARRIDTLRTAERLFRMALEEGDNADDWLGIAEIQMHRMQAGYERSEDAWPKMIAALEHASDRRPADVLAYLGMGFSCIERNFDKAATLLSEARRLDPENYLPHHCSGYWAVSMGDFQSAIKYYDRAIQINPTDIPGTGMRALAYLFSGDREGALQAVASLAELDAEGPLAAAFIAWVESAAGDSGRSLAAARRCVGQLGDSPGALAVLAQALAAAGEVEAAIKVLRTRTPDGGSVGLHALASPAWQSLGHGDRRLSALNHGMEINCPWYVIVRHDPRVSILVDTKGVHRRSPRRREVRKGDRLRSRAGI